MDLIERQAAKEAYCKKFCHPGVMCPDSGFCREVDEAFDSVPSAQPEQRWIPVSERLPEKDGEYWVTNTQGQTVVYVFNTSGNSNSEEYWKRCAIAWKPYYRPEPYQEESE